MVYLSELEIKTKTIKWINQFIVKHNICPFAKNETKTDLQITVVDYQDSKNTKEILVKEFNNLDNNSYVKSSFIIFKQGVDIFDFFLDLLDESSEVLIKNGYEGIYQLASFHPKYQFENTELSDIENYTNRSPFPMLHLIRESSIEKALKHYPNPEQIPDNNITKMKCLDEQEITNLINLL